MKSLLAGLLCFGKQPANTGPDTKEPDATSSTIPTYSPDDIENLVRSTHLCAACRAMLDRQAELLRHRRDTPHLAWRSDWEEHHSSYEKLVEAVGEVDCPVCKTLLGCTRHLSPANGGGGGDTTTTTASSSKFRVSVDAVSANTQLNRSWKLSLVVRRGLETPDEHRGCFFESIDCEYEP